MIILRKYKLYICYITKRSTNHLYSLNEDEIYMTFQFNSFRKVFMNHIKMFLCVRQFTRITTEPDKYANQNCCLIYIFNRHSEHFHIAKPTNFKYCILPKSNYWIDVDTDLTSYKYRYGNTITKYRLLVWLLGRTTPQYYIDTIKNQYSQLDYMYNDKLYNTTIHLANKFLRIYIQDDIDVRLISQIIYQIDWKQSALPTLLNVMDKLIYVNTPTKKYHLELGLRELAK